MDKKTAAAIARTPDDNPDEYARLVRLAVTWNDDRPNGYGVTFTTDYSEWTDYDRREAIESLRQLRGTVYIVPTCARCGAQTDYPQADGCEHCRDQELCEGCGSPYCAGCPA